VKTCKCGGRARCAFCTIVVREERGAWSWSRERSTRRAVVGVFSGRVSADGVSVRPFTGPGPVTLDRALSPGAEVTYALVRTGDGFAAERVKVAA
jgi:hypothetical protein